MKILSFISVFLLSIVSYAQNDFPKLNATWQGDISFGSMIYAPHSMYNKIQFQHKGVKYLGGIDVNKKLVFISTTDTAFNINNIKYIGMPLLVFTNKENIKTIRGWGSYLKINQDWYAAFDFKHLSDNSKVLFVFQSSEL